jgi:hypothetical protein
MNHLHLPLMARVYKAQSRRWSMSLLLKYFGNLCLVLGWASSSLASDQIYNLNYKLKFFVTDQIEAVQEIVIQQIGTKKVQIDLENFECIGALSEEYGVVGVCALRVLVDHQISYSAQITVKNSMQSVMDFDLNLIRLSQL